MMPLVTYATIQRRKGTGLLPPNKRQWDHEHHALDLREELGVPFDVRLDHTAAFASSSGTIVFPHGQLPAAQEFINYFRSNGIRWSGMAIAVAEGVDWVVYNDAHAVTRVRATLMEEFFHVRFDHPRSKVRIYSEDGSIRSFTKQIEEEAYHTGAAALVPFISLNRMLSAGQTVEEIAVHFQVSPNLVLFRAKVTKLYTKARRVRSRR